MSVILLILSIRVIDKNFDLGLLYTQLTSSSTFIDENYIDPKSIKIVFPEQKRNLIYIVMESLERTYLSEEFGGAFPDNLIPEIATLMYDSETELLGGVHTLTSGWTIASLVSQSVGIPLFILTNNENGRNGEFLPNAYSIGQILQDAGYTNSFMMGSDAAFAGRDIFFSTHGSYDLLDWKYAQQNGIIPEDYAVWWGFEDQKLYAWAKEELLKLSQQESPFNFTMLTVDTHHIGGYVCTLCQNEHDDQYANVISCASRQLYNFVSWIKQQDFYENTTIVVVGDHLSMDPNFFVNINSEYERKPLGFIINSAIKTENINNRILSLYDIFPTVLASLGAEINGNRLALGVNLFSEEQTIIEEFSLETVGTELRKTPLFYDIRFFGKD
jgi:phosphoglycerol transferase